MEAQNLIDQFFKAENVNRFVEALGSAIAERRNAELGDAALNDRPEVFVVSLTATDLGTARAQAANTMFPIPAKFRTVRVQRASGADVEVFLVRGKNVDSKPPILLRQNDVIEFSSLNEGWLFWNAQPGETMEILFGVDVSFNQGSLISEQAGGVVISEGTDVETDSVGSVGTLATVLVAQDTTRVLTLIQNKGGIPIYVGDSTVTALTGIEVLPNSSIEWKNSDELYAITSAGTNSNIRIMNLR